jgi:hypothetical protein
MAPRVIYNYSTPRKLALPAKHSPFVTKSVAVQEDAQMLPQPRCPFVIGEIYTDRLGEYKVVSLNGDRMVIEYADGTRKEATTKVKADIYSNIQLEKGCSRSTQTAMRTKSRNGGNGGPRMPNYILPALQALADETEHTSSGIRSFIQTKFTISAEELTQKQRNGCTRFANHVAWALASLNTKEGRNGHTPAVTLVKKEVYKITEYGKFLLRKNLSSLTVADLIHFDRGGRQ